MAVTDVAPSKNAVYDKIQTISAASFPPDGWVADANTWTYSSADHPTYVISINADMTAVLSPGMRIKYTQTVVKYAIITAVGSYSGGATLITVYCGNSLYDVDNEAISGTYYSTAKAPLGFPLNPIYWTEETDRHIQPLTGFPNTERLVQPGIAHSFGPHRRLDCYLPGGDPGCGQHQRRVDGCCQLYPPPTTPKVMRK